MTEVDVRNYWFLMLQLLGFRWFKAIILLFKIILLICDEISLFLLNVLKGWIEALFLMNLLFLLKMDTSADVHQKDVLAVNKAILVKLRDLTQLN